MSPSSPPRPSSPSIPPGVAAFLQHVLDGPTLRDIPDGTVGLGWVGGVPVTVATDLTAAVPALATAARRATPLLIVTAPGEGPTAAPPLAVGHRPAPWVPVVAVGRSPWAVVGADLSILLDADGPADHTDQDPAMAAGLVRRFLGLLRPAAASPTAASPAGASPAGAAPARSASLTELVPFVPDAPYDIAAVLDAIVDAPGMLPLGERGAVLGGLARLGGRTVVVVASDAAHAGGRLDPSALRTVARLTELAASADLPIVSLVDSAGLLPAAAALDDVTTLLGTLGSVWASPATQVTVVLGRAHGAAATVLGAVGARADIVVAWPRPPSPAPTPPAPTRRARPRRPDPAGSTADPVDPVERASAWAAARDGALLDIIAPDETRARLIEALDVLRGAVAFAAPRRSDRG
ncbi:MAG: carboxyl transferase domain-containing protein [Acidimicrobiales bacterium]